MTSGRLADLTRQTALNALVEQYQCADNTAAIKLALAPMNEINQCMEMTAAELAITSKMNIW